MATTNRERQERYRKAKSQVGDSRITCWLSEDDKQRLQRLQIMMNDIGYSKANYSDVFSQALKELEISFTPPVHKNLVRYGLKFLK